ncbi:unnamed protein product [Rhizoctonia solani]|uniref:Uncharacterized protein n=1 Tax=Rhizoctonia solani TaxID=456999 RepID=A0A8H3CCG2_9AGAM|nr:unnamed protein product [Rhizoctonia solani]
MTSNSLSLTSARRFGSLQGLLRFKSRSVTAWWGLYGTALVIMFIANVRFLFPGGLKVKLIPEEYFNFKVSPNGALLLIHLACVLPASMLSIIQFIPRLRAKYTSWHRYAGRIINILTLISSICGIAIGRVSFGGDLATQTATFALGTMVLYSVIAGWKAIRDRKIEEHRIWMTMTCDEVANSLDNTNQFAHEYPQCQPDWAGKPVEHVSIRAGLGEGLSEAAGVRATFGMAAWLAVWIHLVCTERYITMTRRVPKLDVKSD